MEKGGKIMEKLTGRRKIMRNGENKMKMDNFKNNERMKNGQNKKESVFFIFIVYKSLDLWF